MERHDHGRGKRTVGKHKFYELNPLYRISKRRRTLNEYVSDSIEGLLKKIDGSVVETSYGNLSINTDSVDQIYYTPSIKNMFLKFLSYPILQSLIL